MSPNGKFNIKRTSKTGKKIADDTTAAPVEYENKVETFRDALIAMFVDEVDLTIDWTNRNFYGPQSLPSSRSVYTPKIAVTVIIPEKFYNPDGKKLRIRYELQDHITPENYENMILRSLENTPGANVLLNDEYLLKVTRLALSREFQMGLVETRELGYDIR